MKRRFYSLVAIMATVSFFACHKEEPSVKQKGPSQEVLDKISELGFSTKNVLIDEDGHYIVEGDIVLTAKDLAKATPKTKSLSVGKTMQFHTYELVYAPRTIRVGMSSRLPSSYIYALYEAIDRYNAENLSIYFEVVNSSPDITITRGSGNYLASAGFPSNGSPYYQVRVNSSYLGSYPDQSYLATILAHEIGHCIGFRHSDYYDRSYSCGGGYSNEGTSSYGAEHIPGTPDYADDGSFMLACIGTGDNRPFNYYDKIALDYLY